MTKTCEVLLNITGLCWGFKTKGEEQRKTLRVLGRRMNSRQQKAKPACAGFASRRTAMKSPRYKITPREFGFTIRRVWRMYRVIKHGSRPAAASYLFAEATGGSVNIIFKSTSVVNHFLTKLDHHDF
ncbi:MAG: hypothetical protein AAB571_03280 [Chloroflexota bacterium]